MCVSARRICKSFSARKLTIRNKIDLCAFYYHFYGWLFVIKFCNIFFICELGFAKMNTDNGLATPTKEKRVEFGTPNKRKCGTPCNTPNKKNKINMIQLAEEYFVFKEELEIDGELKRFYTCTVCNKPINGTKNSNKTSHLMGHKDVYAKLKIPEESIERKRLKLIMDCVEMVTVNGRSFNHLLDSALHSMISERLSELESAGRSVHLNDSNLKEVKECLRRMSENAKKKISDEIKNCPLALMCDIVTKRGRSIFGFSIQYILNGKHRIRSIGMIHLDESHTGKYLANLIAKRLTEFGVINDQLLTVTTDNGSNMIKMIKDIRQLKLAIASSENSGPSENTA